MRYYPAVGPAIPHRRTCCSRVTHPSATDLELPPGPFDLHVLGTPPAFVLSQDQTLQRLNQLIDRTTWSSESQKLRIWCPLPASLLSTLPVKRGHPSSALSDFSFQRAAATARKFAASM